MTSTGTVIATNDDWQNDPAAEELTAEQLAPGNAAEAATVQALTPGSYTLSDPILTVYAGNGAILATNDDWQDGPNALDLTKNNLAPADPAEAATILFLPAGAYTTIVNGAVDGTGTGLLEIYNLDSP